jgi:hypothetical protein
MQETADQYRHRILSYLNGRDLIKMQAAAPAKLAKLLKGMPRWGSEAPGAGQMVDRGDRGAPRGCGTRWRLSHSRNPRGARMPGYRF